MEKSPQNNPSDPESAEILLERCWAELVKYYRHSAVGQRCLGIVHNFNTPLQVLSFHLELLEQKSKEELQLLQEHLPAQEKLRPLYDYRQQKLKQLSREVENLQTMTQRLVQQGIHEDLQEKIFLDLNRVYQDELEFYLANPFFKHQVEKDFQFQPDLPPIYGHYIDFGQSFRLLVDNALEALKEVERRLLIVETDQYEGYRRLRLGDTGTGIPPEILPRVFEPFFTTKSTPDKPRAGLGLFMARRLLTPYGGQIQVESRPGETWVTVLLPLSPP
ncbi:MAG: HAMP domain-containing sensor histidine kinase [Thermodesulfobacteriota bacterium]